MFLPGDRPGAAGLIDDAIRDGNKVTVLTALPRGIAIKALKKANLSPLFQGRIDPENLVSPLHLADFKTVSTATAAAAVQSQNAQIKANVEAYRVKAASGLEERNSSKSVSSLGDRESLRFDGATVIKCCGLMRKPAGDSFNSMFDRCMTFYSYIFCLSWHIIPNSFSLLHIDFAAH